MTAAAPDARALVLNIGSGTVKWTLFRLRDRAVVTSGSADREADHARQMRQVLQSLPAFAAVGHRIVHGGAAFRDAAIIDAAVRGQLAGLSGLDPLHMEPALAAVDLVARMHPDLPQVAAFDTAFHATLPDAAACYALPHEWTERWGLRRFGFHGLSVEHAIRQLAAIRGPARGHVIVCHLGSGCSVTAVRQGRSADTTMGFSPLEGLMMATRSGSVDPGLLLHLQMRHGLTPQALLDALTTESGLLGVSGISGDLRAVQRAAGEGSPRAILARERFMLDLRRGVGAMAGVLGHVDAIVFTGGIGENDAAVRAGAAAALQGQGLRLDDDANAAGRADADLSGPDSAVRAYVIRSREDVVILDKLQRLLPVIRPAPLPA